MLQRWRLRALCKGDIVQRFLGFLKSSLNSSLTAAVVTLQLKYFRIKLQLLYVYKFPLDKAPIESEPRTDSLNPPSPTHSLKGKVQKPGVTPWLRFLNPSLTLTHRDERDIFKMLFPSPTNEDQPVKDILCEQTCSGSSEAQPAVPLLGVADLAACQGSVQASIRI